jgi:hypothetical protein
MPGSNTLAYLASSSATKENSFITLTPRYADCCSAECYTTITDKCTNLLYYLKKSRAFDKTNKSAQINELAYCSPVPLFLKNFLITLVYKLGCFKAKQNNFESSKTF